MNQAEKLEAYKLNPSGSFSRVSKKRTRNTLPTKVLTDKVIDYVNQHRPNCTARRNNVTGIFIDGVGYTPNKSMQGCADIACIMFGRSVEIEVKYGSDRQSEIQKKYQKKHQKKPRMILKKFQR